MRYPLQLTCHEKSMGGEKGRVGWGSLDVVLETQGSVENYFSVQPKYWSCGGLLGNTFVPEQERVIYIVFLYLLEFFPDFFPQQ